MNQAARPRRWEALLLAAGASTRMGRPKALIPWSGRPLVQHQLRELLATRIRRVVLVLGSRAEQLQRAADVRTWSESERVSVVQNEDWAEGKCGSIRKGAEALSRGATDVALLGVDQPTSAEVLEALMSSFERRGGEGAVPVFRGKRGHPLLLGSVRLTDLHTVDEETQGVRAIVRKMDEMGTLTEVPLAAPCVRYDLNRPEDLARTLQ